VRGQIYYIGGLEVITTKFFQNKCLFRNKTTGNSCESVPPKKNFLIEFFNKKKQCQRLEAVTAIDKKLKELLELRSN
jgi:hypothetical protein